MNSAVSISASVSEDQSHDDLQKANEVISQFITSCSHSMRGPLKSIVGLVNLLQGGAEAGSSQTQLLGMISKNTDRMEHMLDEMEHFLENAKRKVQTETVNSLETIEDLLSMQREAAKVVGVRCTTSVQYDAPCYADRSRIALILSNLVQNAICFRDETRTSPAIKVAIHSNSLNTILTVSDNGIGIDEEFHEKIFWLFFRASSKSNGAGIGLYVVSQAVEKMKGTISVQSVLRKGSTFTVTIPNINNF
jgi:signal transduction histidine kinase